MLRSIDGFPVDAPAQRIWPGSAEALGDASAQAASVRSPTQGLRSNGRSPAIRPGATAAALRPTINSHGAHRRRRRDAGGSWTIAQFKDMGVDPAVRRILPALAATRV
jgi:hypothetical protein